MPLTGIITIVLAATAVVLLVAAVVKAVRRRRSEPFEFKVGLPHLIIIAVLWGIIAGTGGRIASVLSFLLVAGLLLLCFLAWLLWERESGMPARWRNTLMLIAYVLLVADITFGYRYWWRNWGKEGIRMDMASNRSEMRTLGIGLETYYIDNESYPPAVDSDGRLVPFAPDGSTVSAGYVPPLLTTPVAYSHENPLDRFAVGKVTRPFRYATNGTSCWILASPGPDRDDDINVGGYPDPEKGNCDRANFFQHLGPGTAIEYDITNGTRSSGDIVRVGP